MDAPTHKLLMDRLDRSDRHLATLAEGATGPRQKVEGRQLHAVGPGESPSILQSQRLRRL
jgi:hypothetical protein